MSAKLPQNELNLAMLCFTTDVRIRLQDFFVVGGKTRNIVIQLVLQQYRFL